MKKSARTILESAIRDNKDYIREFTEDGNIYDYFAANIEQDETYAYCYFTQEEIEQIEQNRDSIEEIFNPFWDLLSEYNHSIEEFII